MTPRTRGKDNIHIGLTGPGWKLCDLDQGGPGYRPLIDFVNAVITVCRIREKPSGPPSAVHGDLLGGDSGVIRNGIVVGICVSGQCIKTCVLFEEKKAIL